MDIVTIELFDLTVSQAVLEVQRVLDTHPGSALRIVLEDDTHKRNVIKLLEKHERTYNERAQGPVVTIDVKVTKKPVILKPAVVVPAEPKPIPKLSTVPPVLILSGAIGSGDPMTDRRLLLDILRRADVQIPWIGIAHEGASIIRDPMGLKILQDLKASGVSVRVSRECMMFNPEEAAGFEVMEDSVWQSLLIKGNVTKF